MMVIEALHFDQDSAKHRLTYLATWRGRLAERQGNQAKTSAKWMN